MPRFLVTAELLLSSRIKIVDSSSSEYIYENYEVIADDAKEAKDSAYKEYYFNWCYNGAEVIDNPARIWIDAEVIKLHHGKGAGRGGSRQRCGRKKGSGAKYSEPTKAMKVPTRFDGKVSEVIQMSDDLKTFLKNWEEGLQPNEDGRLSERKKLARKMLDDLKAVCGILEDIAQVTED